MDFGLLKSLKSVAMKHRLPLPCSVWKLSSWLRFSHPKHLWWWRCLPYGKKMKQQDVQIWTQKLPWDSQSIKSKAKVGFPLPFHSMESLDHITTNQISMETVVCTYSIDFASNATGTSRKNDFPTRQSFTPLRQYSERLIWCRAAKFLDPRDGPKTWPSHSPDLTPCDFSCWNMLRTKPFEPTFLIILN